MEWYRKAAEAGDYNGMHGIGWLYYNGYGVKLDYAEAMKWYLKAADAGSSSSMQNISVMYVGGYGVNVSMDIANEWHLKAATSREQPPRKARGK